MPLVTRTPSASLFWMVAGGLAYTLGIYFLIFDHRRKFNHAMWHVMVISGSACHFIAIYYLGYVT
jgi:hemolysin III